MHRSPGVFFDHDNGKSHASGKYLYNARVIPYRGSWLDFEFDAKDILYVRIDRRRKLPVTTFLMCLDNEATAKKRAQGPLAPYEAQGLSALDILNTFYTHTHYTVCKGGWQTSFVPEKWRGVKLIHDLVDAKTGEVRLPAGKGREQILTNKYSMILYSIVYYSIVYYSIV
jgi:DNA-directed RNA polymerase subunit beta